MDPAKTEEFKMKPNIIVDRILQLVFLAETNIECCRTVRSFTNRNDELDYIKNLNREETRYLTFVSNNHLFEAVLKLHTILHIPKGESKEVSFQYYNQKVLSLVARGGTAEEYSAWIEKLQGAYAQTLLSDIRNKILAHKEAENVGDPIQEAVLPVDKRFIDEAQEFIDELKKGLAKFFPNAYFHNPIRNANSGLRSILNKLAGCNEE